MSEKKIILGSAKRKHETWFKGTISEKNLRLMLENLQEYNGNKFAKVVLITNEQ